METNSKTTNPVSAFEFGTYAEIAEQAVNGRNGKRFLSGPLALTSCEISINRIPAGRGYGFSHKHRSHEEIYIGVSGRGVLYADGKAYAMKEGTVIRLSPGVVRTMEASEKEPLDYICVQAPENDVPFDYTKDGVPVSLEVPVKNPLPLHPRLEVFFATQRK